MIGIGLGLGSGPGVGVGPPIPTSQTTKPVGTARLLAAFGISRLSTTIFQWGRA